MRGRKRNAYKIFMGNPRERKNYKDLGIHANIIKVIRS
jgi:hypothetical protein